MEAPVAWVVPATESAASEPGIAEEGTPPQHAVDGLISVKVLTPILGIIMICLVDTVRPLPYVAGHIGAAIGRVALGRVLPYG